VAAFLLLVLLGRISAAPVSCPLEGFTIDQAGTQPFNAILDITTQTVNGQSVPATITVQVPNPKLGMWYTEIGPGSSPQAVCAFPSTPNNLWINLGFAYVTPPAAPVNLILWHFYMWPKNQINSIQPTDGGWSDCGPPPAWQPSADITSPGVFLAPPLCVPFMGAHWFPNKMNIFDHNTLIPVWGSYNRTIHFYEYASLDAIWDDLEAEPTHAFTGTYPLPRWPQKSGWYPASVKIELLGAAPYSQVKMTLYAFQYLTSSADWNAQLQQNFDDGKAEGEASCETCDVCDGAFATTVQFASVVLACLFYFLF
jgi:hypothetical protein